MSLLKTNEIQNYNGSSLTLTASTVSTSAQLNTGGNISVTGSLNVSDDSTTRTNLGLGSMATQNLSLLTGMIASFAMSSAPTGWLVCNGAEYAIADYGDLHAAIGTTWGALTNGSGGAGSTHFRVPDLRGAFLRGTGDNASNYMAKDTGSGTRYPFSGPSVGSFDDDLMQGHKHDFSFDTRSTVGTDPTRAANGAPTTFIGLSGTTSSPVTDSTNGTPRTGDETRPFNAGINYCIKY